ncbi:MAG: hypothetical protein WA510_30235, partial [Acidobacteriaceae bacterium]
GSVSTPVPAAFVVFASEFAFNATVAIVQISQCLISSNMLLSPAGLGIGLLLIDLVVAEPQLTVMSNLFTGVMGIYPNDYPALASQIAPTACQTVLNTVAVPFTRAIKREG